MAWSRYAILVLALAPSCVAAAAASLADARIYVVSIYRQLPGDFDFRHARYSSKLGALLRRDDAFALSTGGVGALDWVPFCGCQDTDPDYGILKSSVASRQPGNATVSVSLRNGSDQHFTVDLIWERGSWRVADVHGHDTPSLLAFLAGEVPQEEKSLIVQKRRK